MRRLQPETIISLTAISFVVLAVIVTGVGITYWAYGSNIYGVNFRDDQFWGNEVFLIRRLPVVLIALPAVWITYCAWDQEHGENIGNRSRIVIAMAIGIIISLIGIGSMIDSLQGPGRPILVGV